MTWTHKSSGAGCTYRKRENFQHWYRDNQIYFLTARCRGCYRAFASEDSKAIFWKQFNRFTEKFNFTPWVTSLLDNHYHTVGYLRCGADLAPMMHRIHGSVAKLVNDHLEHKVRGAGGMNAPGLTEKNRLVPFWHDSKRCNYFDGCLRDEKQGRLTYRYVLTQSRRHGVCTDWRTYRHTHVTADVESAITRALECEAFLAGVPYRRYIQGRGH